MSWRDVFKWKIVGNLFKEFSSILHKLDFSLTKLFRCHLHISWANFILKVKRRRLFCPAWAVQRFGGGNWLEVEVITKHDYQSINILLLKSKTNIKQPPFRISNNSPFSLNFQQFIWTTENYWITSIFYSTNNFIIWGWE